MCIQRFIDKSIFRLIPCKIRSAKGFLVCVSKPVIKRYMANIFILLYFTYSISLSGLCWVHHASLGNQISEKYGLDPWNCVLHAVASTAKPLPLATNPPNISTPCHGSGTFPPYENEWMQWFALTDTGSKDTWGAWSKVHWSQWKNISWPQRASDQSHRERFSQTKVIQSSCIQARFAQINMIFHFGFLPSIV